MCYFITIGVPEEHAARQFYAFLDRLYSSRRYPITAETFAYWTECEAHDS